MTSLESGFGSRINNETKLLSDKIEKSASQQVSLEKKMGDMDASNHQLLDKLLAVEQDLDGKLRGVHDNSNGLMDRINALDTDNRDNAQRLVSLQERLVLQTDHITKVESERAKSEVQAKKELEITVDTNARAISDLKSELDKALLGSSALMKESIEKIEKNQQEKISESNNTFVGKVRELEDLMKGTKTEMNNTATKNLHKLEVLEDKINNIDDEQVKFKNQIQEVSKAIKNHSLSIDKVCSEMKIDLDNSVAETNKKLDVFIDDMQKIQNNNSSHLDDHEQKLNKVLALTEDQSEISSAITSRIQSMETKLSSYDEKNKTLTENILVTSETQLKDFRNKFDSRIAELVKRTDQHSDQFDQAELNMVDLIKKIDEKQHHVDRDFEEVKRNAAQEKDLLIIQIKEQNDKFESVFNSIDEKVEIMETKLISQV